MKRGDVVTVAAAGDHGKPRPAVIVQTDAFPESHASIVICQMIPAGLDDKPVTVRRDRIGGTIGRLNESEMARLNVALAFVMGLSD